VFFHLSSTLLPFSDHWSSPPLGLLVVDDALTSLARECFSADRFSPFFSFICRGGLLLNRNLSRMLFRAAASDTRFPSVNCRFRPLHLCALRFFDGFSWRSLSLLQSASRAPSLQRSTAKTNVFFVPWLWPFLSHPGRLMIKRRERSVSGTLIFHFAFSIRRDQCVFFVLFFFALLLGIFPVLRLLLPLVLLRRSPFP